MSTGIRQLSQSMKKRLKKILRTQVESVEMDNFRLPPPVTNPKGPVTVRKPPDPVPKLYTGLPTLHKPPTEGLPNSARLLFPQSQPTARCGKRNVQTKMNRTLFFS